MSPAPKPLISVSAACERLGISRATGYEWARRSELPGLVRLAGRYYVVRAVLERFLDRGDLSVSDQATLNNEAGQA
jgi:predicted site-specific integrase-resolvase